jgi:hypothetical protein
VSSHIPVVTTTMEAAGGLESYTNPSFSGIEDGNLPLPSHTSPDGMLQPSVPPEPTPAFEDKQEDEPPELLHPDDDASDSDSEYDSDDDNDICDEDILAVTQPPIIVEEEATPQTLGV